MNRHEKERLLNEARKIWNQVKAFRDEWASPDIDDFQLLRLAPDIIVTKILKYDYR